ncbi:hypothetical protein ZWY2020_014560, partial [Hordeum vulgare]
KTKNGSNTMAMGARPRLPISFGVMKRKPRPDHISNFEDESSNVDFTIASARRTSGIVSVDFTTRPYAVAFTDFVRRPSTISFAYFIANIFFLVKL